jgi:insecticidal toxin complex protein TccC
MMARDYLPSLDISINQAKQQSTTLHIGTHILSETTESNTQTHYQLTSHLQSNTLELDDKAQTLSYEHYYPYGFCWAWVLSLLAMMAVPP